MKQSTWNRFTYFEQLSNIDGEVVRLVENHENYIKGITDNDYADDYVRKIDKFIRMTAFDPKNQTKGYRVLELMDELGEISRYLKGEVDSDYILRYWNQYTKAIS